MSQLKRIRIVASVTAVFMAVTVCCRAEVIDQTECYNSLRPLKYEYRAFFNPIFNEGITNSDIDEFLKNVTVVLGASGDVNQNNIQDILKDALFEVATYRESAGVVSAISKGYDSEISQYFENGTISGNLQDVYEAVVKVILKERGTDKAELLLRYEEYRNKYNAGLSEYTPDSVSIFEQSLRKAMNILDNANSTQSEIDNIYDGIKNSYDSLVKKANDSTSSEGTTSSGGGSSENVSLPPASNTEHKFTDVENDYWGYEAIIGLSSSGVISGFEDGTFRPESLVTREQMATMLCKALDLPISESSFIYSDVIQGSWYESYVTDISEAGIMLGRGDGTFGIGDVLIRQDLAVIANKVVGMMGYNDFDEVNTQQFEDMDDTSDYAKEAVIAIRKHGIIKGMGENKFFPKGNVTRAQAAQIIYSITKNRLEVK